MWWLGREHHVWASGMEAQMKTDTTKSPDAARPLGASGACSSVQHGNAPSPGDTQTTKHELMDALQNWYDKIGRKRTATFKSYEARLDDAYTAYLKTAKNGKKKKVNAEGQ